MQKQKLLDLSISSSESDIVSLLLYTCPSKSKVQSIFNGKGNTLQNFMESIVKLYFQSTHGIGKITVAIFGNNVSYCHRINSNNNH